MSAGSDTVLRDQCGQPLFCGQRQQRYIPHRPRHRRLQKKRTAGRRIPRRSIIAASKNSAAMPSILNGSGAFSFKILRLEN